MKIESKLGPAYNEFGYNEFPAITNRLLCMNITDCNVRKLGYSEYPQRLVTRCKWDAVYIHLLIQILQTTDGVSK